MSHIRATASGITRSIAEFGLHTSGHHVGERVLALTGGVKVDQRGPAGGVAQTFHQFPEIRTGLSDQSVAGAKVLRVRMLGSAAIDLVWLAEGKTDVCITLGGHPWDIAAGLVIASEAGARFVDLEGHPHTLQSKSMIGVVPDLIPEIICLIADAQD